MILGLIVLFVVSLAVLVKGADWLLESAERIGIHFKMSPFVIGVLLTGIGTSLPELASSIAGILQGAKEVVVANVVGSNIANILLIIGISAVVARRLTITKNLIDLELPLLAISTVLFLGVVYDGVVNPPEAALLVSGYIIYLIYTILNKGDEEMPTPAIVEKVSKKVEERIHYLESLLRIKFMKNAILAKDYIMLVVGVVALTLGAKYLIEAVIGLSELLHIAPSIISITAVAVGTSLPELLVSIKAVLQKKYEVSVGNILGSNAFNALMIVGFPGLFTALPVNGVENENVLLVGVPVMALATLLFIISGISRVIYQWEGMMFLVFYVFFILKLFGIA